MTTGILFLTWPHVNHEYTHESRYPVAVTDLKFTAPDCLSLLIGSNSATTYKRRITIYTYIQFILSSKRTITYNYAFCQIRVKNKSIHKILPYLAVDPIMRMFVCSAYQGRMFFLYIYATKLRTSAGRV